MRAKTYREAIELGATGEDFVFDYRRGFIQFPKHEPHLSGHVFCAMELAEEHQHTHILQDLGLVFRRSTGVDVVLARAFNVRGVNSFNEVLATVFEPEVIEKELEDALRTRQLAERCFANMMNSPTKLDLQLAPEPTRYEQTLPEVCAEHDRWKEAMDDEIACMVKFGVYRRVPKSAAGNRQILGARWVYKRKVNKFGEVVRYRARLVAQGYNQLAFDSYLPDELYSPVVHKDTLRLFLSVCCARNLRVYHADVKSAFLQAPLSERIFIKAPPGYRSTTPDGEEEILELMQAIYGLKQSSCAFWTALHAHLANFAGI
jgi:hypothetical protein